mgnify:CR=1 FL=1
MSEYSPPQHVIREWVQHCDCCTECHQEIPCGGVQAGGICDFACDCINENFILCHCDQDTCDCDV